MDHSWKIAAGYVRTSGKINPKHSIENQKNRINEYCEDNGIILRDILIDDSKTGTQTTGRDAYFKLKELVEKDLINLVIVTFFDRAAREMLELAHFLSTLKNIGVEVYSIEENLNVSQMPPTQIALTAFQAEQENKKRTKRLHGSREQSKEKGKYVVAPPFGYRKNDEGFLIIHEEEAEIVKVIFDKYIDGSSLREIANYLNENFKEETEIKWDSNKVRERLLLKTYTGKWYNSAKKNDDGYYEYRLVSNYEHPAIISIDTFEKAKVKLDKNALKYKRKKHFHLLSRIIICPECREKLKPQVITAAYYCSNKSCTFTTIKKEKIDSKIIEFLKEKAKEEESIEHAEGESEEGRKLKLLTKRKEILEKRFALAEIDYETYESKVKQVLYEFAKVKENEYKSFLSKGLFYKKYLSAIQNQDLEKVKDYMLEDNMSFTYIDDEVIEITKNEHS